MVYVAGGALAVGLIGYGMYRVYKFTTAAQAAESSGGADAGSS